MPNSKPNILLITCHDMGRHLGCYGRDVQTPAINRLASESVRFDRYFCTAPQCCPSRVSITTGRYPHSAGVIGMIGGKMGWPLPDDVPNLAKTFRAAGWSTHIWGMQHEHPDAAALGYEHNHMGCHIAEVSKILASSVTPPLCQWLESNPQGPFFAAVGFFETHVPFLNEPARPEQLGRVEPLPYLPDSPAIRQDLLKLRASVHEVDFAIGQIMRSLTQSGLLENTIVILTTDHGICFPRAKCSLYDAGLETTLLMRWPEHLAQNRVINELLSNIDLMPTLLDLCGVPHPEGIQGRSFAGLLTGGNYQPRNEIFGAMTWHVTYNPMRCIRTNRYKLIRYFDPQPWTVMPLDYWRCCVSSPSMHALFNHRPPEYEMFDLANDPYEQFNLINALWTPELQAMRAELGNRLEQWMQETNDPLRLGPVGLPNSAAPEAAMQK